MQLQKNLFRTNPLSAIRVSADQDDQKARKAQGLVDGSLKVAKISIKTIVVPDGRRPLNKNHVAKLAKDIEAEGLRTPITVYRRSTGEIILVVGSHRLAAFKKLKRKRIAAFFIDEAAAEGWSIAENMLRLSDDYLGRCVALARLAAIRVGEHVDKAGGKQPHDRGINKISEELAIPPRTVSRMLKVASLPEEVKALVKQHKLSGKRTFLASLVEMPSRAHQIQEVLKTANAPAEKVKITAKSKANSYDEEATPATKATKLSLNTAHRLYKLWQTSGLASLYKKQGLKTRITFVKKMFSAKVLRGARRQKKVPVES